MKKLKGKVAAVTGAGSGIGRALAINLAKYGCNLAISDINNDGLQETAEMLKYNGVKISTHIVDVADRKQVYNYADEVVNQHGRVDIIINNAGVAVAETIEDIEYEDFEWVFNINFWGAVYGTKAFLPYLKKQQEGNIVNISSMNGIFTFPKSSPYNASKFALRAFSETLVQELRGTPIKISSVHPGFIKTNLMNNTKYCTHDDQKKTHDEVIELFNKSAITTSDRAARIIISGIKKNKKRLIIGIDAKFLCFVSRLFPVTTTKIIGILMQIIH